jgi:nucleoside recognition membrane protein YjiH
MSGGDPYATDGQKTYRLDQSELESRHIQDFDLTEIRSGPVSKFVVAFAIGAIFFLIPIPWEGQFTVPFDIVVSWITESFPTLSKTYAMLLIVLGGVFTTISELVRRDVLSVGDTVTERLDLAYWETSPAFWFLRSVGAVLALMLYFGVGPQYITSENTGALLFGTLMVSVAVIIPIGAIFINLFVELGGLEFVGTLARPVMRPLFKIPGRAALDSVASWVGSYSVGLYVTRNVFDRGEYNKRDVYIIGTCFGTVSIGFVGVVAATLELLNLFPVIFLSYLVSVVITAAILVRLPPLNNVPREYISEPNPETPVRGSVTDYFRYALSEAVEKADEGASFLEAAVTGFVDGLKLAIMILGTALAIGLAGLIIAEFTPVFDYLSQPLVPVMRALGLPDAQTLAPASIIGVTEMFIPALITAGASPMAKFYVAVLSISQLIFFSAPAPMMMDMFKDIPIRGRDLLLLFVMRTVILIPLVAGITHLVARLGLL